MRLICIWAGAVAWAALLTENPAERIDAQAEIKDTLAKQVAAWNRGDIPGFMDGYVRSKNLRFASGGTTTFGWQSTLDRYQSRYTNRELMGNLTFTGITITELSKDYAEVFGTWKLSRKESSDISGLFTLLMKRTEDGWKVWHDHTSSAK